LTMLRMPAVELGGAGAVSSTFRPPEGQRQGGAGPLAGMSNSAPGAE
jgi:hypothetical protein